MKISDERIAKLYQIVTEQKEMLLEAKDRFEDDIDESCELEEAVFCREEALTAVEEALHFLTGESDDLVLLEYDIKAIFSAHYIEL